MSAITPTGGGTKRRRFIGAALAGVGGTAAGALASASPAQAAATSGMPGDPINVQGITVQQIENREDATFTFDPQFAGAMSGPTVYDDSGSTGTVTGYGTALTVTALHGPGVAVSAASDQDTAVRTTSATGSALVASTSNTASTNDAVVVSTAGRGRAVLASLTNSVNANAAVVGSTTGTGAGIYGAQNSPTATGAAVVGVAGAHGRGGRFSGGAGAVRLMPSAGSSHPRAGKVGDLYVDSAARLWFCKGATAWKQLA